MRHDSRKCRVTLDEAWFYLLSFYWSRINLAQSRRWSRTKGEWSPKMVLTVVWNSRGFHLTNVLPNDSEFNAGRYLSLILSPFPEILAP
jgi:hypothetical protein